MGVAGDDGARFGSRGDDANRFRIAFYDLLDGFRRFGKVAVRFAEIFAREQGAIQAGE